TQVKNELTLLTQEHIAKVAILERQKNLTDLIHKKDKPMRQAIDFLAASISRNACLTGLALDPNGGIFLSGEASSPRVVADIMDTINLSPALEPVRLTNMSTVGRETGRMGIKFDMQTGFVKPDAGPPAAPGPQGGS